MMKRPYVSLSALSSAEDVRVLQVARLQPELAVPASHDLLLGISADRNSVAGITPPMPRKLQNAERLRELASALDGSALLAVHFECYYRHQVIQTISGDIFDFAKQSTSPFADDALRMMDAVPAQMLGAVQLNGVIDPDELARIRAARPDVPVIYQLRRELADRGDADVIAHLEACRAGIAHVLLDLSAGRGVPLQPEERSRLADLVRTTLPDARIGIAGGISSENVGAMYEGAYAQLGHVSLDTETAIREPETDAFDTERSIRFLKTAYAAIRKA